MKKLFLALTGAAVLATSVAIVPDAALARDHRPHWKRHHQVCRVVWKKRRLATSPPACHPLQGASLLVALTIN